jgi:hypothetical protein
MRALRDFMKRVAQAIGEVGRVAIWVVGGACSRSPSTF